jgi:hypothetical protein
MAIYRMDTMLDSLFIREEIIRSTDRASLFQEYSKEPSVPIRRSLIFPF